MALVISIPWKTAKALLLEDPFLEKSRSDLKALLIQLPDDSSPSKKLQRIRDFPNRQVSGHGQSFSRAFTLHNQLAVDRLLSFDQAISALTGVPPAREITSALLYGFRQQIFEGARCLLAMVIEEGIEQLLKQVWMGSRPLTKRDQFFVRKRYLLMLAAVFDQLPHLHVREGGEPLHFSNVEEWRTRSLLIILKVAIA
jgi:hypothetical protein